MPVEIDNAENNDYSLNYYLFDLYAKTRCTLNYYFNTECKFEANEIIYGLYLGNINSVYDSKTLKDLDIQNVISVIAGFEPPFPTDFNYLVVNALDTENTDLTKNFEKTNRFIEEAYENNEKVLIHCMAGRSRSASIVIAFLIKTFGITPETCIDIIKSKRDIIGPNKAFLQQLKKYYNYLYVNTKNEFVD